MDGKSQIVLLMQRVAIHLPQTKRRRTTMHPHSLCLGLPVGPLCKSLAFGRKLQHLQGTQTHTTQQQTCSITFAIFFLFFWNLFVLLLLNHIHIPYTHSFKPLFNNKYYYSKKKKSGKIDQTNSHRCHFPFYPTFI